MAKPAHLAVKQIPKGDQWAAKKGKGRKRASKTKNLAKLTTK